MSNLTNHALASQSHAAHNQADGAPQRGTFRAVLADPPWCSQQTGRHGAAQHYRLMPLPQLRAMGEAVREITAPRSFCFVWVTTATVPQGIELLEAWGFRYTSFYFWAKPRFSMGHTFRNAGELLLLGVRGQGAPGWPFGPSPTGASTRCRSTRTSRRRSTRSSSDWWATGPLWSCSPAGRLHHTSTGTSGATSAPRPSRWPAGAIACRAISSGRRRRWLRLTMKQQQTLWMLLARRARHESDERTD